MMRSTSPATWSTTIRVPNLLHMPATNINIENRQIRKEKLVETAANIRQRIETRFPDSGLSQIASEVVTISEEAVRRANAISQPNRWLRAGLGVLIAIAVAGIIVYLWNRTGETSLGIALLEFLDAAKGSAAVLTAFAVFLVTLEVRLKRRRALQAIHELRAMAHLIDMHQLTKDPDRLNDPSEPLDVAGKPMSSGDVDRYLHFCTELLAIISKIGQIYVQGFPDSAAQNAVDQFENLTTGLSSKIWQKLTILERVRR